MIDDIGSLSSLALRDLWRKSIGEPYVRDEALWEYWRRVAEKEIPFSKDDFDELLALRSTRIVDVLGILAARDRLPDDAFRAARRLQRTLDDDVWLVAQLDAREMILRLKAGEIVSLQVLCGALVAKGTAWAASEAVPLLNREQLEALITASEQRRVFTKGQRHDLKVKASKYTALTK